MGNIVMKKALVLFVSIICVCLLITPFSSYAADGVPKEVLSKTPAVFYVEAWSGMQGSSGTAFLIHSASERSLLLTNEHVISVNPKNVSVYLSEKEQCKAKVIAASEQYDLAVLEVTQYLGNELSFSEEVSQGDAIFAVGFPGDADRLSDTHAVTSSQATITDGVVSAIRTMKLVEYGPTVSIVQMNADINHGNSGGPLFNKDGNVVGVNTYGVTSANGIYGAISTDSIIVYLKETNLFSEVTLVHDKTINQDPVVISPASVDDMESYFSGKAIPVYWTFVSAAILAAGLIVIMLIIVKNRKRTRASKSSPRISSYSLNDYLNRLDNCLSCDDIVSLLVPVAKDMRDKHADGSLLLHLVPESISVNDSGCFINHSSNIYSKPQFTAPEQISKGIATIKTDVYSFCKLMDYLFQYGRVNNETLEASDSEKLFHKIIDKGTKVDPEERYPSMQEVLFDLAALNAGSLSKEAKKPFAEYYEQSQNTNKQHRCIKPIIAASIVTVGLIAISIVAIQLISYKMMDKYARENDPEKLCFWVNQSIIEDNTEYSNYAWAGHYMSVGNNMDASAIYYKLGDFYDSQTLYKECQYNYGDDLLSSKQYAKAAEVFSELGSYKDAADKIKEVSYQQAKTLMDSGNYNGAIEVYQTIIDYKDSADQIKGALYRKASALANAGEYDAAIKVFESIRDYKDSKEQINTTQYRKGYSFLSSQQYSKAEDVFKKLKTAGYSDAVEALNETYFTWSVDLADKKDYVGAYQKLQNCKNYKGASELIDALIPAIYGEGVEKYDADQYSEAKKRFSAVKNYKRSGDYLFLIQCHSSWLSEQDIKKLTNLIGFEDAGTLMFKDDTAFYFLIGGTWYGNNGNMRFYEKNDSWWITHDMGLSGSGSWSIKNNVFSVGETKNFYIIATGKDTIVIEYIKTGRQYTMTRK